MFEAISHMGAMFASGLATVDDGNSALAEAAADLPTEVEGYPHLTGINLHDGLAGKGEEVAMLAYQELPMPFVGGSAGDDLALSETHVFVGDEIATDAVAFGVIASKKRLPQSVNHGHGRSGRRTEATVHERGGDLDRRPNL